MTRSSKTLGEPISLAGSMGSAVEAKNAAERVDHSNTSSQAYAMAGDEHNRPYVPPGEGGQDDSSDQGKSGLGGGQSRRRRSRRIPPKLYRIGDLVEYLGVSRQTIHNYTTMGILRESCWSNGGHRLYDESAFGRLDLIAELRTKRKSLQYIREYFARLETQEPGSSSESES